MRSARTSGSRWSTPTSAGACRGRSRRDPGRSAPFRPYWVEEPTSPDEVLGLHRIRAAVTPVQIAAGEHVANRVVFKQMLQAGALDFLQIDACRVAGVNENIAILLLAAKFGVPKVCPHMPHGVGLCEMVQHLAMFDYAAVSASVTGRVIEYVDHLHEHFVDPVRIVAGRYRAPTAPGFSSTLRPQHAGGSRVPARIRVAGPGACDRITTTPTPHNERSGGDGRARVMRTKRRVLTVAAAAAVSALLAACAAPAAVRAPGRAPDRPPGWSGQDRHRPDLQQHCILVGVHQLRAAGREADEDQAARPAARRGRRQPAEPAD